MTSGPIPSSRMFASFRGCSRLFADVELHRGDRFTFRAYERFRTVASGLQSGFRPPGHASCRPSPGVRTLGLMGLHELTRALEREEARLRVAHDAPDLMASDARSLQAAYERSEWAKAELANDSPHANAQALINMTSALDAMVEELVKHWRRFHVERIADDIIAKGQEAAGHVLEQIEPNALAAVQKVVRREAERIVPAALRPRGPASLATRDH